MNYIVFKLLTKYQNISSSILSDSTINTDFQCFTKFTPNFTPSYVKLGVFFLSAYIQIYVPYNLIIAFKFHNNIFNMNIYFYFELKVL